MLLPTMIEASELCGVSCTPRKSPTATSMSTRQPSFSKKAFIRSTSEVPSSTTSSFMSGCGLSSSVIGVLLVRLVGPVISTQLWLVTREDEVPLFDVLVTGMALFHICFWTRFTFLIKLCVTPAAGCRVLLRVLDHELQVPGRSFAWNKRLLTPKRFIVLLRRDVFPSYSAYDRAFREGKFALAIGFDCHIVSQNGADVVQVTFFVGHRDKPPVAITFGNLGYEDGGGFVRGVSRCARGKGYKAGQCCNCK